MTENKCAVEECDWAATHKGWCRAHYMRQWRTGGDLSLSHRWMDQKTKLYIIGELMKGRTLVAVATEVGYDPSSISVMFRKEVGMSLREWKRSNR